MSFAVGLADLSAAEGLPCLAAPAVASPPFDIAVGCFWGSYGVSLKAHFAVAARNIAATSVLDRCQRDTHASAQVAAESAYLSVVGSLGTADAHVVVDTELILGTEFDFGNDIVRAQVVAVTNEFAPGIQVAEANGVVANAEVLVGTHAVPDVAVAAVAGIAATALDSGPFGLSEDGVAAEGDFRSNVAAAAPHVPIVPFVAV